MTSEPTRAALTLVLFVGTLLAMPLFCAPPVPPTLPACTPDHEGDVYVLQDTHERWVCRHDQMVPLP